MKWQTLTIGKKIAFTLTVVLSLLLIIGTLANIGVGTIVSNAESVINGNRLDAMLAQKEVDHLNWVNKVNQLLTDDSVTSLAVQTDDHKCGMGQWLYSDKRKEAEQQVPSLVPLLKKLEEPHHQLHLSAIAIGKAFKPSDPGLPTKILAIEIAHLKWANLIRDGIIAEQDDLQNVQTDPDKCIMGQWLHSANAQKAYENGNSRYQEVFDAIGAGHARMHTSAIRIKGFLKSGEIAAAKKVFAMETSPMLEKTLQDLDVLRTETEHGLEGIQKANKIYATETAPALQQVQELLHQIRNTAKKEAMADKVMLEAAKSTRFKVSITALAALLIGGVMAFFLTRGINSLLETVAARMDDGADHVSSASGQVLANSHSLAEGAAQQAAALEETSASLEEISSMTKNNATSATQARNFMQEASTVISTAEEAMGKLTLSMDEISEASDETAKIIKTIDEIAFQTNLLALNAAVEAARAGEAGAGFAVVADEVRSLAMRAAEAAKHTAEMLDDTKGKVDNGSQQVTATSKSFTMVSEISTKINALIDEIADGSNEQATGFEQLSKAVSEIDSVTQQNAAIAEESADSSAGLNDQAGYMKTLVEELLVMVCGDAGLNAQRQTSSAKLLAPPEEGAI